MRTKLTLEKDEILKCNNCAREVDLFNAWFVLAPASAALSTEVSYWPYCSSECLEQLTIEFAIEDAEHEAVMS